MKKIIALLLAAVLAIGLVACTSNTPSNPSSAPSAPNSENPVDTTPADKGTYKVGISMYVMDGGMTALSGLMKDTLASADIDIEVFVTSADQSTEKQNSDIEDLVTKGCDLIWVQGFDKNAIVGALENAYSAGVKVAISTEADTDSYTYRYANATDEQTGEMQAEWFIENYLKKNPNTTYKIAMCNGVMSTPGGAGRRNGVVWSLEKSGCTNYEIVTEQDCNYTTEAAQAWAASVV